MLALLRDSSRSLMFAGRENKTYLDIEFSPYIFRATVIPVFVLSLHLHPFVLEIGLDGAQDLCTVLIKIRWELLHGRNGCHDTSLPRFRFITRPHLQPKLFRDAVDRNSFALDDPPSQ